jgi:ABC-2 type transport system permease protein
MSATGPGALLPARPGLRRTARDCLTMAHRALLTIRHSPEQLSDVTVQPVVFTLMFTYIFGGAIAGDTASYLPFFIPGILVQSVIMTSAATGVQLREDMSTGVFDRFRSLPIARVAPLGGAMLADLLRYALAGVVTLGVGLAMGYRPAGGAGGLLAACLLVAGCAVALSWMFAFFGVVARSAASVQNTSMLVMFVLTFVSNAFVPAGSMPGWLQPVVAVNPVSHLVTATRALADGQGWTADVLWALIGAGVIAVLFAPLTLRRYMRRT